MKHKIFGAAAAFACAFSIHLTAYAHVADASSKVKVAESVVPSEPANSQQKPQGSAQSAGGEITVQNTAPQTTAPQTTGAQPTAPQTTPAPITIRDKWAIVVGITQFANNRVPQLRYATKDAADFANYLIHEGNFARDHVRVLLNEKATQRRILSELGNKLPTRLSSPDDLVVLFFSTHGSPSQIDFNHRSYLLAYDSEPDELFSSGLDMQKLVELIKSRIRAQHIVLVLDACHSGRVAPNAKGISRAGNFDPKEFVEGSVEIVICSSSSDEQSWESKRYPNGVFTKNLLDALRSNGPNAPLINAFQSTKERVESEVREDHADATQTPCVQAKSESDGLVLAIKPSQPQEIPPTVLAELEPDSVASPKPVQEKTEVAFLPPPPLQHEKSIVAPPQEAPTSDVLKLTYKYFSNEADPRKALASAFSLKSQFFNDPQYGFAAAKIRMQMGQFSSANQDLKGLLTAEPNNWQMLLAKGYCLHKLGQEGEARDYIRQAQFHNPTLPRQIDWGD